MSAYRTQRHKALPLIVDFLDRNYPCDCPRTDPCGSNTAEAIEVVQTVLEAVAADIWEQGAESGWQATGEGWNGEYANGTTHDGAQSFRDAGNDTPNPYRASETA